MDTSSIRRAQPLLGTFIEIAAAGAAPCALERAIDKAFGVVAQVHRLMSFHEPESDVSRLNGQAFRRAIRVHAWTYKVLETALEFSRRSAGVFDITVAPFLQQRGLLPGGMNDPDLNVRWIAASANVELLDGYRVRYNDPYVRIDLGGIAKGFAVDRALAALREQDLVRGLVNAGGDLAAFGVEPELIHIRDPNDAHRSICQIEICNAALASSGRLIDPHKLSNTGESPVIDPRSGTQVHANAGATVRAPTCMVADALTKVVMITGQRAVELLQQYRASAFLFLESGDVWITPDWQDVVRLAA
jgi:thiamine biosynthesis lipoprotein